MTQTPLPESSKPVAADLLEILRCPLTLSRLHPEGGWLVAEVGGLAYPVREGIPVMLVEEARLPDGVASLDEFRTKFKDQIRR